MKKRLILTLLLISLCITGSYEHKAIKTKPFPEYADFRTTLSYIKYHEGWYANYKDDKGKETYCGITRRYSPSWYGWRHIDAYKRNYGPLAAHQYLPELDLWITDYYLDIWIKEGFYRLKNQKTADYLFDFRINAGMGAFLIKQTLREIGFKTNVDNKLTEDDILLINKLNQARFLKKVKSKRVWLYTYLAKSDTTQKKWLKGWMKRANKI